MRISINASHLLATTSQIATLDAQPKILRQIASVAVAQIVLFDFLGRRLLKHKDVLAARQLLFPSLNLLLTRECVGLENTIDHGCKLRVCSVELSITIEALDCQRCIISILFRLCSNSQFGHLGGGFVSFDNLSRSTDVESEGVLRQRIVKSVMVSIASATSVEALEANVKTIRIVLYGTGLAS
ncbi:hypothetical protein HG530_005819 [Fusarium avenaceum]|nr:hypothetical protein HG530_005819 [Fusarium avenaceum]